jgi:sugar lactone lactonase YvrE
MMEQPQMTAQRRLTARWRMTANSGGATWGCSALGLVATLLAAAGCGGTTSPVTPTSGTSSASTATATATAASTVSAAPAPSPSGDPLAGCPAAIPESALPVLARLPGQPDDVIAAPNGTLWVGDESTGRISELSTGGTVLSTLTVGNGPEGIIVDGTTLLVAEQLANRVVRITPQGGTTTVVTLTNRTGQAGVDGLGVDAERGLLLIPDSPLGALRAVPLGGGALRTLATGLSRPVAASVGSDGALYVADEGATGLWRIPRDGGRPVAVGHERDLDEVISEGRLLYVTDLGAGTVRAIDPTTGAARVLVSGDGSPQGLALAAGGHRLVLTDSNRGLVMTLPTCA